MRLGSFVLVACATIATITAGAAFGIGLAERDGAARAQVASTALPLSRRVDSTVDRYTYSAHPHTPRRRLTPAQRWISDTARPLVAHDSDPRVSLNVRGWEGAPPVSVYVNATGVNVYQQRRIKEASRWLIRKNGALVKVDDWAMLDLRQPEARHWWLYGADGRASCPPDTQRRAALDLIACGYTGLWLDNLLTKPAQWFKPNPGLDDAELGRRARRARPRTAGRAPRRRAVHRERPLDRHRLRVRTDPRARRRPADRAARPARRPAHHRGRRDRRRPELRRPARDPMVVPTQARLRRCDARSGAPACSGRRPTASTSPRATPPASDASRTAATPTTARAPAPPGDAATRSGRATCAAPPSTPHGPAHLRAGRRRRRPLRITPGAAGAATALTSAPRSRRAPTPAPRSPASSPVDSSPSTPARSACGSPCRTAAAA